MYNILTLDKISNLIFNELTDDKYVVNNEYKGSINQDAVIVRSRNMHEMQFDSNVLAIARAGAGVNTIPVKRCTEEGIVVFNTPGANANSVKEMVICAIIMGFRNVIESIEWTRSLKGQGEKVPELAEKGKKNFNGNEIKGKKIGILGLGATGGLVAEAALALGMKVYGYDPYISVKNAWNLSNAVIMSSKEEILQSCDVVSIHIPLTKDTKDYIGKEEFSLMKDNVILLNFSRADLVDRGELVNAFNNGKVHKYIVDFPTDDILCREKVICLPHLASSTEESENNCAIMAAKEIVNYLENGSIENSVNFPSLVMQKNGEHRIAVIHKNEVGVINSITNILRELNVNILNMRNVSNDDVAYSVFDTNKSIDINKIATVEEVLKCRVIY